MKFPPRVTNSVNKKTLFLRAPYLTMTKQQVKEIPAMLQHLDFIIQNVEIKSKPMTDDSICKLFKRGISAPAMFRT